MINAQQDVPPAKYVYGFSEGSRDMRDLLGGKGANVAEMIRVLGPDRVPPGFTITTEACRAFLGEGREPNGMRDEVSAALTRLEERTGRALGAPDDPLLVSVRSGAPISMPGMMDTVLNLGLNDESVEGLSRRTGNPRFAWDSYRRFAQMFGNVVRGIPGALFEERLAAARESAGVASDAQLDAGALQHLTAEFKEIAKEEAGDPLPDRPHDQLHEAIRAVFESWRAPRAIDYRRLNRISDQMGTAANVQAMVFGNTGTRSGSGVAFSRDELTGAPTPSGDFLGNAQGEDVVSGRRRTQNLDGMAAELPKPHAELMELLTTLETHFGDMQDVEFTVEDGHLFLLQTRTAKRPAQAAVRFAVDAVAEGLLDKAAALLTVDADRLESMLLPTLDPEADYAVLARGVGASPGAAKGRIALSASEAIARAGEGEDVILVRQFTEADDVAGFNAARGILTAEGGRASHAALVARGMGRPCVAGADGLRVDLDAGLLEVGEQTLRAGDEIAIDGSEGIVTLDDVPLIEPEPDENLEQVLRWADEIRTLGVRANADTGRDAGRSVGLGAEGIGLCRTEHMFFGADRDGLVRELFIAAERWRKLDVAARRAAEDDKGRWESEAETAGHEFQRQLALLEELQRADFEDVFRALGSRPATIRLLDPPLHEFLPVSQMEQELELAQAGADAEAVRASEERLELVRGLEETNPMIGTRGGRLGILYPQLYEMQVRAIIRAGLAVRSEGCEPHIEIMLPLIAYEGELAELRNLVVDAATALLEDEAASIDYSIGTMVELPRSCLIADRISAYADFFSFGTNDLTQTAIGLSRDDVEGRFIDVYIEHDILDRSPFESLDEPGVGELVRIASSEGRRTNPDLHLGICGEHGGDPASIEFFHELGLDYVSCSPIRVPVARLAAAQAAISGAQRIERD